MQWPVNIDCYCILTNKVLPLSYRRSNIVASRYYVLRYYKRRLYRVIYVCKGMSCILTSRLEILYVKWQLNVITTVLQETFYRTV